MSPGFRALALPFLFRGGKGSPDPGKIILPDLLQSGDGKPAAFLRLTAGESGGDIPLQSLFFLPDDPGQPLSGGEVLSASGLSLQLLQREEDLLLCQEPVRPAAEFPAQRIGKQSDQAQLLIEGSLFQLFL